jgi:hypothetical protein
MRYDKQKTAKSVSKESRTIRSVEENFSILGLSTPLKIITLLLSLGIFLLDLLLYNSNGWLFASLIGLGNALTLMATAIYLTKVNMAVMILFISQLVTSLASVVYGSNIGLVEIILSTIALVVILYRTNKHLKKEGYKFTPYNFICVKIKAYRISAINKILLVTLIVTLLFIQARYDITSEQNIGLLGTTYFTLPIVVLLTTILGVDDTQYIRFIYYIVWASLLGMASSMQLITSMQILEPALLIVGVCIGYIAAKANNNRETKNAQQTKEDSSNKCGKDNTN